MGRSGVFGSSLNTIFSSSLSIAAFFIDFFELVRTGFELIAGSLD